MKNAKLSTLPGRPGLFSISASGRTPIRTECDWEEAIPSREGIPVERRLAESIVVSSSLSKLPVLGRESAAEVVRMVPDDVVPVLKRANIDFVLVGAHGAGGWMMETRATQDVDFLIHLRDARAGAEAVLASFPNLAMEKNPDVWRFKNDGKYVLDLMLTRSAFMKRIFKEFHTLTMKGQQIKVPKLEAAMAMKFAAMTGHYRSPLKKGQDALDFISMISANRKIDVSLLRELGELVYEGGGAHAAQYVDDVRTGKKLEI